MMSATPDFGQGVRRLFPKPFGCVFTRMTRISVGMTALFPEALPQRCYLIGQAGKLILKGVTNVTFKPVTHSVHSRIIGWMD